MKVLFLGSPEFARIVLERVANSKHKIVGVVTQPDRPSGRGHKLVKPDAKIFAEQNGIPVYQFEKIRQNMDAIREIDYDIALVASFGQILSEEFLNHRLTINVHPSLLPKYRGATPIQSAILNGDSETGVTIMKLVKEVDAGDILLQEKVEIEQGEVYSSLANRLGLIGGDMAVHALNLIESGNAHFKPQDHSEATFVKLIKKEDGHVDFSAGAEEIVNKFRALGEKPGVYITVGNDNIKLGGIVKAEEVGEPGQLISSKKHLIIGCKNGSVEITALQAPSGKMLRAVDFLNGYKLEGKEIK